MYWTRALLKSKAKTVLRRYYWIVFVTCLISGAIGGAGTSVLSFSMNVSSSELVIRNSGIALVTMLIIILVVLLIGFGVSIFVINVLRVGLCRFLMETRQGNPSIGNLFWAFRGCRYMRVVKTMFLYSLHIFLWTLLFIIPGIVKAYQYCYVPYILAENPDIESRRVLSLSRSMTYGEKSEIFILNLSFIGWSILASLACGLGGVFLNPYINATFAELYAYARERSIQQGITGPDELHGFYNTMNPNMYPPNMYPPNVYPPPMYPPNVYPPPMYPPNVYPPSMYPPSMYPPYTPPYNQQQPHLHPQPAEDGLKTEDDCEPQ